MAMFAHNSKAPCFTRKYMYYCTNHTPSRIFSPCCTKKIPNIQNNTARAFSFFIFLKKKIPTHIMKCSINPKILIKASQCVGKVGGIYLSSHELTLLQWTNKYELQWETMNVSLMSLFIYATWALKYTFNVFSPSTLLVWSVANALKPKSLYSFDWFVFPKYN